MRSVLRGLDFLCSAQEADGTYRDYAMAPGQSDGWMTAFVAVAISQAARHCPSPSAALAVRRAAEALRNAVRPSGWGYNSRTTTDGDSTAFGVRAVARAGLPLPLEAEALLDRYLDEDGQGHTYVGERFGGWAGRHADVTPSIGLALSESGARVECRRRVVQAALTSQDKSGVWHPYWWRQPHYATWLNLQFLAAEGALSAATAEAAVRGLVERGQPLTDLDCAALLGASCIRARVTGQAVPPGYIRDLAERQMSDGGWSASLSLVLQPQDPQTQCPTYYSDVRRLFTTANAVHALSLCP